jgi:hypothetical protein
MTGNKPVYTGTMDSNGAPTIMCLSRIPPYTGFQVQALMLATFLCLGSWVAMAAKVRAVCYNQVFKMKVMTGKVQ